MPMRKLSTARWRRYALAFVVLGASLGVAGCADLKDDHVDHPLPPPTEPPPPELPPPGVCPAGTQACLSISPESAIFAQNHEVHTFTVLNSGPGTTSPLTTGFLHGGDLIVLFTVQNGCAVQQLGPGEWCTLGVEFAIDVQGGNPAVDGFLVVGSSNSQLDANTGVHGVSAHVSRSF
jgi:hypothetical protein